MIKQTYYRGYHSLLGIRIFYGKTVIFTKDKDISSVILGFRDEPLHTNDKGINGKI